VEESENEIATKYSSIGGIRMALDLVFVAKGSFTMGEAWDDPEIEEESDDARPTHKVTFTYDFWLDRYETTFNEYDDFCEDTDRNKPSDEGWGRGTRPVINVNWWDAIAYCNWLSDREKFPRAYDREGNFLDIYGRITTDPSKVAGYRLPTEAEWEYAARGRERGKDYRYSGSDDITQVAWCANSVENYEKTQEVGKKAPNILGLYDMSGNVYEWCSGWWYKYTNAPKTNPYNGKNDSGWVVCRGGSWYTDEVDVRIPDRHRSYPTSIDNGQGFRIARTVSNTVVKASGPSGMVDRSSSTISWTGNDRDREIVKYKYKKDGGDWTDYGLNTSYTWRDYSEGPHTFEVMAHGNDGSCFQPVRWQFIYSTRKVVVGEMVRVERGSFIMGDTWGDGRIWRPTHRVIFTYDFYIGKYETTFDEYNVFCEDAFRNKPEDKGWGRGSRPVINVTWWDAIAYCNWLSEKEKLPKAYDDKGNLLDKDGRETTDPSKVVGYRLPTEAEWEYAARGGNKSKGYKYAGSDNVNDVAWYWRNSGDKYLTGDWGGWGTIMENNCRTQEVGKKVPNELGIYDMSGNVEEWCSDWYGDYSSSAQTNPYNSTAGSDRVFRGGGCYSGATRVRVAYRNYYSPTDTYSNLGFRIARTVH